MRKLGFQVLTWVDGALEYCLHSKAQHIKVLDPNPEILKRLKDEIPGCFITYRRYVDDGAQQQLLANPKEGAHNFANAILTATDKARPYIDAYEGLNETGLWEAADRYSEWTAEYARIMRSQGCKTVAYNFSPGNPPGYYQGDGNAHPDEFRQGLREYWAHYFDGLRESDYLGLHEYGAPTMQSSATWHCLRYRRVWEILPDDCRKPILITETGVDGGMIGRSNKTQCGWRAFGHTEEQYLGQLRWYAEELNKDSYVLGAHIYHAGAADQMWASFDILGCAKIADLIASYGAVNFGTSGNEKVKSTPFEFVLGFKEFAQQFPEVGEPTSELRQLGDAVSYQFTSNGLLVWNKDGNEVKFFQQTRGRR